MKMRFFFAFVTFLAVSLLCRGESDKSYSDRKLNERVAPLEERVAKLESKIDNLNVELHTLQMAVSNYWATGVKNLDALQTDIAEYNKSLEKVRGRANAGGRNGTIALLISLSIVLVIVGIICLVFWPRKPVQAVPSRLAADKNKCPRCGWEHDPGDTVCKNPNCKTQF